MSLLAHSSHWARRVTANISGVAGKIARRANSSTANETAQAARASSSSASSASASASSLPPPPAGALSPARAARQRRILWSLGAFASVGFLFPFYLYMQNTSHHYTGSAPLTPAQRIRGAYINSSTRDIGPDPKWQQRFDIQRVEAPEFTEQQRQAAEAAAAAAGSNAQKK